MIQATMHEHAIMSTPCFPKQTQTSLSQTDVKSPNLEKQVFDTKFYQNTLQQHIMKVCGGLFIAAINLHLSNIHKLLTFTYWCVKIQSHRDKHDKLRGKIHLKYEALIITKRHFYAQSLKYM
jgi:hypothetical protein